MMWLLHFGAGRCRAALLGAAFVSNSLGVAPGEEWLGQFLATMVLGGLCGLIAGLILAQIMRYLSFLSGRNFGGHVWTFLSAVVGATVFALAALTGGEDG